LIPALRVRLLKVGPAPVVRFWLTPWLAHTPAQFEAFKTLADEGKGPREIAARFGCSPGTVKERLRLALVSAFLFELYRAEEMNLDQ
jgi:DNA-binding CsgD family transcriptional regulator